ncbi:Uncharacterised protein [Salmonella enterica subsp. enterica]|uniref:Uncharacterized protein n=1 Tax=Salmonella enterica I TaxID=59201 RepID=A0A447MTE8_SALET|nr:Uncharacterised protein [Salmonella enterica subsp. enterica]
MSTDLDPTQLAIEFLRRDKTETFSRAVFEAFKTAGVRVCRSPHPLCNRTEKKEIYFAWRLGVH